MFLKSLLSKRFISALLISLAVMFSGWGIQQAATHESGMFKVTYGTVNAISSSDYTYVNPNANIEFQAALNALPATGGTIQVLSSGSIDFATTVTRAIDNVIIIGAGRGTAFTLDGINPPFVAGGNNWQFENCSFDIAPTMGATTNWLWTNVIVGATVYTTRNPSYSIIGGAVVATNITDSGLTAGQAVYTDTGGLLSSEAGYEYNAVTNTLSVPNATVTTANITTLNAPTGRSATYVVAASDATAHVKAQADAICDGTNDEVTINTYLALGSVKLLDGTYDIKAAVEVPSNTSLTGESWATILEVDNTAIPFQVVTNSDWAGGNTNIYIGNFIIDGNLDTTTNNGGLVHLVNCTDSEIDHVCAHHANTHGIEVVQSQRIMINNCMAYGCGDDGISLDDGNFAPGGTVGASVSRDILVNNCISHSNDGIGGWSAGFEINDGVERATFTNCIATGNHRGFDVHTHSGNTPPAYITFNNCIARNSTGVGATDYEKIYSGYGFTNWANNDVLAANHVSYVNCISIDNAGGGISLNKTSYATIEGCIISDNTRYGIALLNYCYDVNISGCEINTSYVSGDARVDYQVGIFVQAFERLTISNNNINNMGEKGIFLGGVTTTITTSRDFIIDGNTIDNCANSGIRVQAYEHDIIGGIISNNIVTDCGGAPGSQIGNDTGITVGAFSAGISLSGVSILGNKCYNTDAIIQPYGILIDSSNATSVAEVVIIDNDVRGNTYGIHTNGSGTETITSCYNNKGYISPSEVRTASGSLTGGATNAILFSWHNPEAQDIFIKKVVINITTADADAANIDVGISDDATYTNGGTEFFNDLTGEATGVYDSIATATIGQQTVWVLCQDSASATDGWVVAKILDNDGTSIVGSWYIEYCGK